MGGCRSLPRLVSLCILCIHKMYEDPEVLSPHGTPDHRHGDMYGDKEIDISLDTKKLELGW